MNAIARRKMDSPRLQARNDLQKWRRTNGASDSLLRVRRISCVRANESSGLASCERSPFSEISEGAINVVENHRSVHRDRKRASERREAQCTRRRRAIVSRKPPKSFESAILDTVWQIGYYIGDIPPENRRAAGHLPDDRELEYPLSGPRGGLPEPMDRDPIARGA